MKLTVVAFITFISSVHSGAEQRFICPDWCQCERNSTVVSCRHADETSIPNDLPRSIVDLDVSFNSIEAIPSLDATKLTKLSLCHNHVAALSRGTFSRTNALQTLDVSHNSLTSLAAEDLDGLESLLLLDLSWNELRKLDLYAFHKVPNLRTLKLSGNPLKYVDSSWFKNLDVLEYLELRAIGAYSLAANCFVNAPRLHTIDLSENDFTDVPKELESARNLKFLFMNQNPVVNLTRSSLSGARNLEELHMSRMARLESVEKGSFWNMRHLALVNMSNNVRLKSMSGSAFHWIKSPVVKVDLTNSSLQTLDYAFSGLCDEGLLSIDGNPWMCDCQIMWMRQCNATMDLRCNGPPPLTNKSIGQLKLSEMTCPFSQTLLLRFEETVSNKLVLATVGVCALTIILGAGMCIWHGRRRRVQNDSRYSAVHYVHVAPKSDAT